MKIKSLTAVVTAIIMCLSLSACAGKDKKNTEPAQIEGLEFKERVKLNYATQFSIDRYSGGVSVITTKSGKYLIAPDGNGDIENNDLKVIHKGADNIYLAATAVMDYFDKLGMADKIRFSGTRADGWYIDSAKNAITDGKMIYAGKYSEPDYEMLISGKCALSIQSTMIDHAPEAKEKLEELGITVFTDYSSYEDSPLARCEWIKVYGEIMGCPDKAKEVFDEQAEKVNAVKTSESTGKKVVYFHINNNGQAVTRKNGDYISKMIELAGGENVFEDYSDSSDASSVTVEMEKFYETAKDADIIIYNSLIYGEVNSVDEMIRKNELIKDFKAVKEGNVWCTKNNLYQEVMKTGEIIRDFHSIFTDKTKENPPKYLFHLTGGEINGG